MLHADQGNGTGSICLTSDAGGITLNPGTFVSVGGIADAEIRLFEDTGAGSNYAAIKVQNMSASYTLTLPADDGCCGETLTTDGSGTLTWESAASGSTEATQTNMEAEATGTIFAPPDLIRHSPGIAKVWARWEQTGGTHTMGASYNMDGMIDGGAAGFSDLEFGADFSSGEYAITGSQEAAGIFTMESGSAAAGTLTIRFMDTSGTYTDATHASVVIFGEQV
jgi:hypothetical protein